MVFSLEERERGQVKCDFINHLIPNMKTSSRCQSYTLQAKKKSAGRMRFGKGLAD